MAMISDAKTAKDDIKSMNKDMNIAKDNVRYHDIVDTMKIDNVHDINNCM